MELILTPLGFVVLSAGIIAALPALANPVYGLILLVVAAVAVDYASHDLVLMAAADAAILAMLGLNVMREKQLLSPGARLRLHTRADRYFGWILTLAILYLIVGISRGNDLVYVMGDFFHLALEIAVPFFLFVIFLRRRERFEGFLSHLSVWMVLFAGLVILLYVTGVFQKLPGAGYTYRGLDILRIRYNHHFPLLPLVWLIGIWLFQPGSRKRTWTGLAIVALTIVLVLGLKRSLWVALAVVLLFYLASIGARQRFRALGTAFGGVALALVLSSLFLPKELLDEASELGTYTEVVRQRFDKRESDIMVSIENRQVQLADAMGNAMRNPLGYGLGSEFDMVFSKAQGELIPTHYVHNGYLHYVLQIGVWWLLVIVFLTVHVFTRGLRLFRQLPEGVLKGAVLGAMGTYFAIIITSITEITFNTFFLPYSVAAIHVVGAIAEREGLIGKASGRSEFAIAAEHGA